MHWIGDQRDLYQIAEESGAHFTAKQYASFGCTRSKRNYHVALIALRSFRRQLRSDPSRPAVRGERR